MSCTINALVSQVLYNERFNTLTLNTGTYTANSSTQTYLYNDVANGMSAIKGDTISAQISNGNYPFKASGQEKKAWLAYVAPGGIDTFAVSTSWLNPIGTANAWLITPTIIGITANSVLTWDAMAPDINNTDGYEVYITTNTSTTPVIGDFSTIVFNTTAESNTWKNHGVSLAAYAGQNIRIAFKNTSYDKYQLWVDNIKVQNVTNGFDASTESHSVYKYSSVGSPNTITAVFKNNGFAPITNLTINYKVGNDPTVTEIKILSPSLNYQESTSLSFAIPYTSFTPAYNTIKIWTSTINGQNDQVSNNDTITGAITISASIPGKKVLVEEFTGASYGWCPDGYTILNSIVTTNTNVIAAAIHNNDQMSSPEGDVLTADYAATFPSAAIDQYYFSDTKKVSLDRWSWNTYITQRAAMQVPATVTVTNVNYNNTTQEIDATVSSTFVGDVKGDYRLNLYIKENNIYGPMADSLIDNQWNQHSYLFNTNPSPYYQAGNSLDASTNLLSPVQYKHQYVVNKMLDGAYGASGIIPTNGSTNGQTYSKNYSYVLPAPLSGEFRYNADNIYLIGVLSEYNADTKSRSILNVAEVKLNGNPEAVVGIRELNANTIQLNVFPNPASDVCHLTYTLKNDEYVTVNVYNTLGELVYIETKNASAGHVIHTLNLHELRPGNYSVQISFKNTTITKKLIVIK